MPDPTTCVIIDDHEVVRAGTRARLEQVSWISVVGEAGTCADGIQLLRRVSPRVALVDLRLPDGDGIDIVSQIARDCPDTNIVLYSAMAPHHIVQRGLSDGASGFVLKGSAFSVVVDALDAARHDRRYVDPTIAAELLGGDGAAQLSPREHEILPMVAAGAQNATIAHDLSISTETVKAHISNILLKLDAANRTEAVVKAIRVGLIE